MHQGAAVLLEGALDNNPVDYSQRPEEHTLRWKGA